MTPSGIDAYEPAWSPDGREILYLKEDRLTCGIPCDDLDAIRLDGRSARSIYRKLRLPSGSLVSAPSWSPDGTLLATKSYGVHRAEADTLAVTPRDGRPFRWLADNHFAWSYSWSPDSRWICLSGGPAGAVHLYVVGLTGRAPIEIRRANVGGCTWSPDSRQVAFSDGEDIFVSDIDGSHTRRLTSDPAREIAPAWSSNGTIAFLRQHGRGPQAAYDMWTMRPDGSGQRWLTFNASRLAWSPDGTTLAFLRSGHPPESDYDRAQAEDPQGLWVIRPDRSGQRLIARGPTTEFAWQPRS